MDEQRVQLVKRDSLLPALAQRVHLVVRRQGVTAIIATHDPVLLGFADRVLELHDGELVTGAQPAVV